jgi:hypothetical protein
MKIKTILTLSLLITLTTVAGCKLKKEDAAAAVETGTTTTTSPKATLTSWNIGNGAWYARLDLNGANLSGTPFTLVFKYADNSETHCSGTELTGTESSGTFEVTGSCTGPGTGSMSDLGDPNIFETTGVGSYSNDGSELKLCATASSNCIDYNP